MQWLSNHTEDLQSQFAEYCRTGNPVNLPGTSSQRMKHYRRLSFNVVSNALEQAYPITQQVLTDDEWLDLVDSFYSNHKSQTPLLWQMPYEFYEYIEDNDIALKGEYPFLPELLYFEWLEIEVHTMEDVPLPENFEAKATFNTGEKIVINPEYRLVQLTHPLHVMALEEAIKQPGTYYVLIYRDPDNGNVRFMNLSVLFAFAFDTLAQQPATIAALSQQVEKKFNLTEEQNVPQHLQAFIHEMVQQKAVLGSIK